MRDFISARSQYTFNKEDYAVCLYIQGVPAKVIQTSRGGWAYLHC